MFAVGDYVMFQGDPDCTGTVTAVDGTRVFVVWDDGAENDWFDESQLEYA